MRKPPIIANHNGPPNPTAGREKFSGAASLHTPLSWCRRSSGHKHPEPRLCWEVHHMILHLGDVHIIPLGRCTYNLAGPGCRDVRASTHRPSLPVWLYHSVPPKRLRMCEEKLIPTTSQGKRSRGYRRRRLFPERRQGLAEAWVAFRHEDSGLPAAPEASGEGQVTRVRHRIQAKGNRAPELLRKDSLL
ncbi:hypothetical protein B0H14DRAFT_2604302 [Mycena olivaceomarginata]|nr:hypothetical protein B0H14DRAFT_2604302 [Mycena olivaceomarginata]